MSAVSAPVASVRGGRNTCLAAGVHAAQVAGRWAVAAAKLLVRLPGRGLLGLLWIYQRFISPMTPPSCRYYPSCSQYAVIAIRRHGALRGSWLAARRLGRCHPWAAGGVDDVPPARETSARFGPRRARSSTR